MQVRHPDFDLSASVPLWGDHLEAVQVVNAGGVIPPPIERYLIKVLRRAKAELDPVADADLIRDIGLFSKQEAQHFKLHTDYLEMIERNGYPRIREFEAAFEADLDGFLATKDLAWNLAYGEGFESSGAAMAAAWLDGAMAEHCGDRGSVPMQLWVWHLAEEFEHRTVVHDVMHRLLGAERAFELRSTVGAWARSHYGDHTARAAAYLLGVDRATMTPEAVEASRGREVEAWLGMGAMVGDALDWILDPDYDPRDVPTPDGYGPTLARFS